MSNTEKFAGTKHEGATAAYVVTHEAWYSGAIGDRQEVMAGMYYPEDSGSGCTTGEFAFRQHSDIAVRLEVFSDGWDALRVMDEEFGLLRAIAALDEGATLDDVVGALSALGFVDLTERRDPSRQSHDALRRSGLAKLTVAEAKALGVDRC